MNKLNKIYFQNEKKNVEKKRKKSNDREHSLCKVISLVDG